MELTLTCNKLLLRPIKSSDVSLLFRIYASTREREMEMIGFWNNEQKEEFLKQQFTAQSIYYKQHYQESNFYIIEQNEQPIGRLYIDDVLLKSIRIVDITLLPEHRNKGIGTSLLNDILNHATARNRSVSIHVENFNPALELYKKLGFRLVSQTNSVYYLMEYKVDKKASMKLPA